MQSQSDDELQTLRERAYGLKADIHDDVAALRRLRELELRDQSLTPAVDRIPGGNPAVPPGEPAFPIEVPPATPKAPLRSEPRWRWPVLWIASVLLAIIATAIVSESVIQRVQVAPYGVGATQVARLGVEPGAELPGSFATGETPDTQVFSEFYNLRVLVSPNGYLLGQNFDDCMLVMRSDVYAEATADSYSGPVFTGCAANDFPASVTVKVTGDMPEELLVDYPAGTALQFVFDKTESEIVVLSSPS